jgi:hypothetical protein
MSSIAVVDDFKELLSQAKTQLVIKSLVQLGGKAVRLILGDKYDNYEILIKDNGDVIADDNIKLGNIYQDQQSLINRLQENSVTGGSAAFVPGTGMGVATKNAFIKKKKKKKSYKLSSLLNELQYPDKKDIFLKIKIKANKIFNKNPANWNDQIWYNLFKLYNVNSNEFFQWYRNNLDGDELMVEGISYGKFKTESKTRSKSEALHKAVKEVKKRVSEINRLMEYTNRMRNELNEGGDLKYSRFTENAINQISTMVAELYGNVKKLKK